MVLSDYILDELAGHYVGKFKASPDQAEVAVAMLRQQCEFVTPTDVPPEAFEDADDMPVLGTAIAGRTDCLVTGDQRLLTLGDNQGIPLLAPRELYDRLQASGRGE